MLATDASLEQWDDYGVPTLAKLHELGIDFPELVEVVNQHDSRRSPVGVR